MARDTKVELRNQVIYSVYVRNHGTPPQISDMGQGSLPKADLDSQRESNYTKEGTFRALEADLPRIRALGADIVWLMPIHPIGVEGKKGSLGCPYANRDYRDVNPEYGTMDDFRHLVDAIHAQGMKCIIDVVYNHTSPDSVLRYAHPEFFHRTAEGKFGNRIGDWADVIDLNYDVPELWDYQIASLKFWAGIVDGFRCDVATLVPLEFWKRARAACAEVKPGLIWLAETIHLGFNRYARRLGFHPCTDSEAYEAFDLQYDYDIREHLDAYWDGKRPLHEWIDAMNRQEAVYPDNYIKMRCLENHDQPRIASRITDPKALENWNAFLFFQKGTTLLYAGEERCDTHVPSLFDRDPVNWSGPDITGQLTRLIDLKKRCFPADGWFDAQADDGQHAVLARIGNAGSEFMGLFSLRGTPARMQTDLSDGNYTNLLTGAQVTIAGGSVATQGDPLVLQIRG